MPRGFEGFSQRRRIVPEMEPYHEDDNSRDYQKGEKGYKRPFVSSKDVVDSASENWEDEIVAKIDAEISGQDSRDDGLTSEEVKKAKQALEKATVKPRSVREKKEQNRVVYSTKGKSQDREAA